MVVGALLAVSFASSASADIIRITATGTIQGSNLGQFAVNQSMTVVLEYESNGAPQFIANSQAFYVDHIKYISFSSGAWNTSASGSFGQINKSDNLANTDGISFQVASNQGYYQFTNPKPQVVNLANAGGSSFENVFINFSSFSNAVWNNYDLPTSYNFADFNQTQNASFGFSNGSFFVGWSNVQAEVIPAPAVSALVAAGLVAAKRRRRAA